MRINEECINHNVYLLMLELSSNIYDLESEHQKDMTLGEIAGIMDLAERLKEVLQA